MEKEKRGEIEGREREGGKEGENRREKKRVGWWGVGWGGVLYCTVLYCMTAEKSHVVR